MPEIALPAEIFKDIPPPRIVISIKVPYGTCDICAKKVWWFQKSMEAKVADPNDTGTTYTHSRHTRCFKRAKLAAQRRYERAVFQRAMESLAIAVERVAEGNK